MYRHQNVVTCIGNIVVANETRIIAEQDTAIIVTWQRASPVKTPFILSLVAYISKTNSVTPNFYF